MVNKGGYPPQIEKIIQSNCAVSGCHNSASKQAAGGINLESWQSLFEGSNSGSPVIPFSSRFSPLMYFINTYPELGLQATPVMPLNRPPLSKEEVQTIRSWINNGARDRDGNVKWSEPRRKKLYVANQGCDVITVLDAETGLPIRAVQVGIKSGNDAPHQIRVSPDGEFWYVIFVNSNFMQKFRCSDDSFVGDVPLTPYAGGLTTDPSQNAQDWNAFVISADGKKAFCTSWTQNGKISVVDLENRRFIKWLGGQHFPHGIVLSKAGDKLYVTAQTGNFITELDTGLTGAEQIPLESVLNYNSSLDPHDMVLSENGEELLITCQKSNDVRVLDLNSKTVKAIVKTGEYPQEIVYARQTGKYYVSCTSDTTTVSGANGVITSFDASSYSVSHIRCGYQPHGIAVNELTSTLYVLSRNVAQSGVPPHHGSICNGRNGFLNIVDLNTFTVKPGAFELSVDPYFIIARP